jgi:uncharacterized protein YbjT (DUF2867 family)
MALTSVLVLGPSGGFGQYILPELIRRKESFKRVGAFVDVTRPQDAKKTAALQSYAKQGVEVVKASPGDIEPFKGRHRIDQTQAFS